jgi:hypothetical protein
MSKSGKERQKEYYYRKRLAGKCGQGGCQTITSKSFCDPHRARIKQYVKDIRLRIKEALKREKEKQT